MLLILDAMKMETDVGASQGGTVRGIAVMSGVGVSVGVTVLSLGYR
ncbi:biotin/lipoyl-containing protein [Salmonella enterica subsp. enterica serovar Infantis]